MLDVHSHILPAVDDGVRTLDDAILILRRLEGMGFTHVVATPHYYPGKYVPSLSAVDAALNQVRAEASQVELSIEILRGRECFLDYELMTAPEKETFPFVWKNQRYQLIEVPEVTNPAVVETYAKTLRENRIQPILAHAERYGPIIRNPKLVTEYIALGFRIQIDLISFSQKAHPKLRETAKAILENEWVHLAASDVHRPSQLDKIQEGLNYLQTRFGNDEAKKFFNLY